MKEYIIVHNPRCSKSRATLDILISHGIQPIVIDYLNGELTEELLRNICHKMGKSPKDILRTGEEDFKALSINLNDDREVIKAIIKHPKILERPIVMSNEIAVIGRPPENVLSLITG